MFSAMIWFCLGIFAGILICFTQYYDDDDSDDEM